MGVRCGGSRFSRSGVSSPAKTRKRSRFKQAAASSSTISAPAARSGLMMNSTLILAGEAMKYFLSQNHRAHQEGIRGGGA